MQKLSENKIRKKSGIWLKNKMILKTYFSVKLRKLSTISDSFAKMGNQDTAGHNNTMASGFLSFSDRGKGKFIFCNCLIKVQLQN